MSMLVGENVRRALLARPRRLAAAMFATSALALASPAMAQVLPVVTNDDGANLSNFNIGGNNDFGLRVNIGNQNRVIDWASFNIGSATSSVERVDFVTNGNGNASRTVINRVAVGNPSAIFGSITAESNIAVWLVNPSGITFNSTGGFSGGSLVLTTAALTDQGATQRLQVGAANGAAITIATGASLISSGSIVAAAQNISAGGTITADGDVALIAATDVIVPTDPGSPLGITITAGTRVGTATLAANGTISGANVRMLGTAANAVEVLLNVDSGASLTATAAGGRVVIASGATGDGLTIGGVAADNNGTASITTAGTLSGPILQLVTSGTLAASGSLTGSGAGTAITLDAADITGIAAARANLSAVNGGVSLTSLAGITLGSITAADSLLVTAPTNLTLGNVTLTGAAADLTLTATAGNLAVGALAAGDDIVLSAAAGDITLGDNVTAGTTDAQGDFTATAESLTLGNDTLAATGLVDLTATAGSLAGSNGLVITSNSGNAVDAAVGRALRLSATGGSILLSGSTLNGGTDGIRSAVLVTPPAAASVVTLGTINARALSIGAGTVATDVTIGTATLVEDFTLTLTAGDFAGAIDTDGSISITADTGAISAGALDADGSISLTATTGALDATTLTAGADLTLTATAGNLGITGALSAGDDVILSAANGSITLGGNVTAGTGNAQGDLTASARSLALGNDTLSATGLVGLTATAGSLAGSNGLVITSNSGNAADGGNTRTLSLSATGGSIGLAGTTLNGGADGIRSEVRVTTPAAAFTTTLGTVNGRDLVFAGDTAAGDVTIGAATIAASFDLTLTSGDFSGSLTSTGGSIIITANTGDIDAVALSADFNLGLTATTGRIDIGTLDAGVDIEVIATAGDIATTGAITSSDELILTAGGSISFGNDATAGSALAVGEFTATADSITLGSGTLAATGLITLTSTAGGISGSNGLVVTSNRLNAVDPGVDRALTLSATGGSISLAGSTLNGGADGTRSAVLVTPPAAASTVTLGTVNARALTFAGDTAATSVTLGTATLVDDFTLTLTAGDFAGAIDTDGSISITADAGTINAGALAAGGSIALTATVGAIDATTLTAGADISLTATAGNLGVTGALGAGDDVVLSAANGSITLGGNVTAGTGNAQGDLTATAESLVLGNDTLSATGLVGLTSTAGSLAGSNGLVITSNSDNAVDAGVGRALSLSATGGSISLAGSTLNGGADGTRSAVRVTTPAAGSTTTLGTINARALAFAGNTAADDVSLGAATLVDDFTLTLTSGDFAGAVDTDGSVAITADTGDITPGALTAGGDISLIATAGQITAGGLTAGDDILLDAATNIALSGSNRAGTVDAQGDITLISGQGMQLTGPGTINASGAIALTGGAQTIALSGGIVLRSNEQAGGTSLADAGDTRAITITTGSQLLTATNSTLAGGLARQSRVFVNVPNAANQESQLGTVRARGLVFTSAGQAAGTTAGSFRLVDGLLTEAFSLTSLTNVQGVRIGRLETTAGSISITATNNISGLSPGVAGRLLTTLQGATLVAGGVGSDLTLSGQTIQLGNSAAADPEASRAARNVSLEATQGIDVIGVTATAGTLDITAGTGGDAATATVIARNDTSSDGLRAGGTIDIQTPGDASVLGPVVAGSAYTASARSLALGGVAQSAAGAIGLTATGGSLSGTAGLVLTSNSGNAADAGVVRALSLSATGGSISLAGTTLNGGADGTRSAVRITPPAAASTVTLGTVNARVLAFAGGTAATDVTLGTATLVEDFALTLTTGNFARVGGSGIFASDGSITITADAGNINSGALDAGGNIGLTATLGDITAGALDAGGSLTLSAPAGTITATGSLSAGTDLSLTATVLSITVPMLSANGDLSLTATTGNLGVTGALSAGDDILLSAAAGSITLGGNVTAGTGNAQGDLTASARSLALGNDALSASGLVGLTSTAGAIAGTAGLTITSNSGNAADAGTGRALSLSATGGNIALAGSTLNGGANGIRSAVLVTSPAAAFTTTLGTVNARALSFAGDTAANSVTLGTATLVDSFTLTLNSGSFAGTVSSGGSISITQASGNFNAGAFDAGAALSLTATAGNLTIGAVSAGTDITLSAAAGIVSVGVVDAGNAAGDDVIITGTAITLGGAVTAGGGITLNGNANSSAGISLTASNGDIDTDNLTAATSIGLTASNGTITAGSIGAQTLTIGAGTTGDSVTFGNATLVNSFALTLTGGNFQSGSITTSGAGSSIGITASTGNVTTGALTALTDIAATATLGTLSVGAIDAGNGAGDTVSLIASAGGITLGGNIQAGGNVTLDGTATSAASVSITADTGNITADALNAGTDVTLTAAAGTIGVGAIDAGNAAGDDVSLTGTALTLAGAITAGGGITLDGNAGSAAGISLVADNGDVLTDNLTAATTVALTATNGAITTGNIGAATLSIGAGTTGDSVTIGNATLTNSFAVTLTGGNFQSGFITTSAPASSIGITASTGTIATGALSAGTSIGLTATLGTITAGNIAAQTLTIGGGTTANTVTIGDATLTNSFALTLTGGNFQSGFITTSAPASSIAVTASTGNITTAALTTGTDVSLSALAGTISVGAIDAGNSAADIVSLAATAITLNGAIGAGGITLNGNASSATSVSLTASNGNIVTDALDAASFIGLSATTGSITTGALTAGSDATLTAALGTISVGAIDVGNSAADDVSLTATAITLNGAITAGGEIDLNGNASSAAGISLAAANGDIETDNLTAATTVTLVAPNGTITTGDIGAQTLSIGGGVVADSVTLGTLTLVNSFALTLTGGDFLSGGIATSAPASSIGITANSGTITTAALSAGNDVSLTANAGTISVGGITAGDDIALTATAITLGGSIQAGGDITLSGDASSAAGISLAATSGNIVTDALDAATAIGVTATAGNITTAALTAGTDVGLSALAGTISVGTIDAGDTAADTVSLAATAITLGGAITAGGGITLDGNAASASSISLAADNGDIVTDTLDAATSIGVTATNGSITSGALTAGTDVTLAALLGTISVGAIDAGNGAGDDVSLTATALTLGGPIMAGGDITLNGNADSAGSISLSATSGDIDTDDLTAATSVTLTATSGNITSGSIGAGGDVTASAVAGTISVGAIDAGNGAGDDVGLTATAITLGGAITTGGGITFDGNASSAAGISLTADNGDILTDDLTAATTVAMTATNGTITAGNIGALALTIGGGTTGDSVTLGTATLVDSFALTLTGGNFIGRMSVANGSITITADAGNVTSTLLGASQAVTASGLSLDIDETAAGFGNPGTNFDATLTAANDLTAETVTATGDIRLASTAGNLATTVALAPGDDVVLGAANGSITLGGDVTAGTTDAQGDFTATARSLVLGNGTLAATGLVGLTATAGSLSGSAGLVITANSNSVADAGDSRALSLSATGGSIALAGSTLNGGSDGVRSAVLITPPAAASTVTLGTVDARALVFAGNTAGTSVTLGTATLVDSFALTLTSGNFIGRMSVANGSITVAADAGNVTSTRLGASQAVTATGLSLDIDETAAGFGNPGTNFDATLTAANDLTAEIVTATGDIRLASTGGNLATTTAFAAGDDVVLGAAGTLTLGSSITAGTSDAQGDFEATGASLALGDGPIAATGRIDLTSTSGDIAGNNGLVITANSAGLADAQPGTRGLTFTTGRDIALAGATLNGGTARQSDVTINAAAGPARTIALGTVRARSLLVNGLDGDLSLIDGDFSGAIDITSTQGALRIGTLAADGDVRLTAVTISGLAPGAAPEVPPRLLTGFGGALLTAGGDLVLRASDVQLDNSSAAGAIDIAATESIDVRRLQAGTTLTLLASASNNSGGITGRDALTAGGDISLAAFDDIRLGVAAGLNASSAGGSISINSRAGNVASLAAFGPVSGFVIGTSSSDSLRLVAAGEAVVVTGTTTAAIDLSGTGSWRIGELVSTASGIDIAGTAVTGLGTTPGAVLGAPTGNNGLRLGALAGTVTVSAGSDGVATTAQLDRVTAGGTITVNGDRVAIGEATSSAGSIAVNAGSGLSLGTATALTGEVFAQGQGGTPPVPSAGASDPDFGGATLTASGAAGRIGIIVSDLAQIAAATSGTALAAGTTRIDIAAGRAAITTATAFNGGIAIVTGDATASGALTIGTATATGGIDLGKTAGSGNLVATTLTAGTVAGGSSGIGLASDTDIIVSGAILATRGSVTATAARNIDLATVTVTGLAPDAGANGAVLDNLSLTATSGSITATRLDVEGSATLTATGTIASTAIPADIALTTVTARLGGIAITADAGGVTIAGDGASPVLGLDAATNVAIGARDTIAIVTAPADEASVLARTGFIDIASTNGSITGIAAPAAISGVRITTIDAGSASIDVAGEAVIGTIVTSGDIAINPGGGGFVRLESATSSAGSITAEAQDLTGLAFNDDAGVAAIVAPTFAATLGAVTLAAGDSIAARQVSAGTDASLTADRINLTTADIGGALTINAGAALALARADAASVTIAATGSSNAASSGLPAPGFGSADLTASGGAGAITVTTSELAQLGQVSTGTAVPVASDRIAITAGRTTIDLLTAGNGGISVTTLGGTTGATRDGALEVGPVSAAGSVRLAKLGGGDGLTGTSIVAGTGSDAAGNITITSNTSAIVSTLTANGGDIGITSTFGTFIDGDVTALEAVIGGSLTGGNYSITAGGIALGDGDTLVNHRADNRVTLTALGSAINVATISGGRGLVLASNVAESGADPLLLRARDGINLPGITMGGATLASRSAAIAIGNDTAALTLGRVAALRLQGLEAADIDPAAGRELRVLGEVNFLADVTVIDSLRLVSTGRDAAPGVTAIAGGITSRAIDVAGANASLALVAQRGAITVLGQPAAVPLRGLAAGGDIMLQARGDIRILAADPDQDSVVSQSGSITALSEAGSIGGLDPFAVTQGFRAFALSGGSADVVSGGEAVIGSIDVAGDIAINPASAGSGFIRLGTASSSGGDITINARELTGLASGDDAVVAAPVAPTFTARAGSISLTASDTIEARRITAGADATVSADRIRIETASAGGVLQLVAGSGLALLNGSGGSAVILSGNGGSGFDSAGLPIAGHGRADLFATGASGQTITITASELAQLDDVAAGIAANPAVTDALTIDIAAGRASINTVTASNGGLRLAATGGTLTGVASAGALSIGSATAGSGVRLTKAGGDLADAANIIDIDSLTAGSKAGATGGITITSNSDVDVTTLVATRGNVAITAVRDIDLGSATISGSTAGVGASFGATATTGSITADSITGTGDITLLASGDAPGAGASYASDIRVGRVTASLGSIALRTPQGAITVLGFPAGTIPALDANVDVTLAAEGDITIVDGDAATASVLARTGNILATSTAGSIRGATLLAIGGASRLFDLGVSSTADLALDGETLIGTLAASGDITITDTGAGTGGSSFVRLGQATSSGGDIAITARELTGLPGRDDAGVATFAAPSFVATLGSVSLTAADVIQASSVIAGGNASFDAGGSIAIGNLAAGGPTLASTGTLWLGTVRTGALDITATASAGSDSNGLPETGFGAANLAVTGTALPTIRVTISELAQLGRITAGPADAETVSAADVVAGEAASVTITAGRTTIADVQVNNGGLAVTTTGTTRTDSVAAAGALVIDNGVVATGVRLTKAGGELPAGSDATVNDLRLGTLVAGGSAAAVGGIAITSNTDVSATSLTATRGNVGITAVRDIDLGSASVAGSTGDVGATFGATATSGSIDADTVTSTGNVTLLADRDIGLGTTTTTAALATLTATATTGSIAATTTATTGNVSLIAARDIGLGTVSVGTGTLVARTESGAIRASGAIIAAGDVTLTTNGTAIGETTLNSDIALASVRSVNGAIAITAQRGHVRGNAALANIGGVAVDAVTAGSIGLTVRGEGVIGDLSAGGNIAITGGTLRLRNATTSAGTITATADVLTGLAGGSDVGSNNGPVLTANGNVTVSAGNVPGSVPGGTIARDAEIASITAGGSIAVNADAIAVGSASGSSVTLTAGRALRLDTASSAGAVTLIGGVAAPASTGGVPVDGFGRANLVASGSAGRVTATIVNAAQLGNVQAGTAAAESTTNTIAITAANADIATIAANNGSASVTANGTAASTRLTVGTATATTNLILTVPAGTLTVGSATARRVSLIGRDVVVNGPVRSDDLLVAVSAGTTNARIGDGLTDTGPAFSLSQAEVNQLNGDRVTIDTTAAGGAITTTIGNLALDNDTGDTRFALLSTGRITLAGALGDAALPVGLARASGGLARTVQLGGTDTAPLGLADIAAGTGLASRIDGIVTPEGGPSITLPSGVLDLRARMVLFGSQATFERLAALGVNGTISDTIVDGIAREIVSNPGSLLYTGSTLASRTYLSANQLTLNYRDLALFQNTGNQASAAGIALGTANPLQSVTTLALTLNSGGSTVPSNAFAAFGTVNGFVNRTVAVLPAAVVSFAEGTGGTRITRLVLANSRLNGCVVGSPDRGCLIQDIPPPTLRILDERKLQLFDPSVDLTVPFNPLVGTNNETLIGDITTTGAAACSVPGTAGCPVQEPRP